MIFTIQKGWPGLDPKPTYALETSPSFSPLPISRKRARSPFESPRNSTSPALRRGQRGRSPSPEISMNHTYDRYRPGSRYSSYSEPSPLYRRERSPRRRYAEERPYSGQHTSGSNNISIKSSRYSRSKLLVDTRRVSSSPELITPIESIERNNVFVHGNDEYGNEISKGNCLILPQVRWTIYTAKTDED